MSDPNGTDDARPSRADVDDVADAAIGVDTRIFRTLWDTLLFTPRVVEAAYAGDRDTYVPIIRLFLVLFGLQFAAMAFLGLPIGLTLEQMETSPESAEAVRLWLSQNDVSRDAIAQTLERIAQLTTTPMTFLGTLPFMLLLKAYKPSRSFFGHLLAYLAATNSSYLLLFPFFVLAFFGPVDLMFWSGMAISFAWYFIAMARLLYRFYSRNLFVVALQTFGLILMTPVMFIIITVVMFVTIDIGLRLAHDMSIFELFMISAQFTPEEIAQ